MSVRMFTGDCRAIMAELDAESVDAVVCDPPYGFGFMGREWDTFVPAAVRRRQQQRDRKGTERRSERWPGKIGTSQGGGVAVQYDETPTGNGRFQAWCEEWAGECLWALKPGGYLLACGGPRTFHRLTCAIEDAGFEIRDCLLWLYGSGFPKSRNISPELGTALKPAWEPIIMARKPLAGTVAANVAAHGTGALNIDRCRIETDDNLNGGAYSGGTRNPILGDERTAIAAGMHGENGRLAPEQYAQPIGRWPANVILDEDAAALLDAQSGIRGAGNHPARRRGIGFTESEGRENSGTTGDRRATERGGASRFFYCAKASRRERNAGLEGMPEKMLRWSSGDQNPGSFQSEGTAKRAANHHPTVKPIDVMRWLVRLVTPAGGVVLDPFMGSGTTGIACVLEGVGFVGIERDAEYVEIAERRIAYWSARPRQAAMHSLV